MSRSQWLQFTMLQGHEPQVVSSSSDPSDPSDPSNRQGAAAVWNGAPNPDALHLPPHNQEVAWLTPPKNNLKLNTKWEDKIDELMNWWRYNFEDIQKMSGLRSEETSSCWCHTDSAVLWAAWVHAEPWTTRKRDRLVCEPDSHTVLPQTNTCLLKIIQSGVGICWNQHPFFWEPTPAQKISSTEPLSFKPSDTRVCSCQIAVVVVSNDTIASIQSI